MSRTIATTFVLGAILVISSLMGAAQLPSSEVTSHEQTQDQWVGEFIKHAEFDSHREGQFGQAQRITISKKEDGYYLSKPYQDRRFTELEKGVLSDGDGGLGKIYFGTVEYAGGLNARILRVDFCYEDFLLYSEAKVHTKVNESKVN